ncbi:MAG: carboxylating nicotinate-nucleotide diphosphorylase [Phycisphaerae bacterium]|nr:carboxylating nicotinate-nucleotide diphosphorylase [Phycisphaerae bacterium]
MEDVGRLVDWALVEDGDGLDITSEVAVPSNESGDYVLIAREAGVFAGRIVLDVFAARFGDRGVIIQAEAQDGQTFDGGERLAVLSGSRRDILRLERPLLNFLQRLCGVASITHRFVDEVAGTEARILDTRKTIPGWRQLDKYAVRCGGGMNHRMGLHDAVLVKDNHLIGVPTEGLTQLTRDLVRRARRAEPRPDFVEIEVDSLAQLREVLTAGGPPGGADRVLLDNFSVRHLREAVEMRDAGPGAAVKLEASGSVALRSVRAIAETGVDFISVGALTHSAPCLDLALDVESS